MREGDYLFDAGGVSLDEQTSPGELLLHQAEQMVPLTCSILIKIHNLASLRCVPCVVNELLAIVGLGGGTVAVAEQTAGQVGNLSAHSRYVDAGSCGVYRGFLAQFMVD